MNAFTMLWGDHFTEAHFLLCCSFPELKPVIYVKFKLHADVVVWIKILCIKLYMQLNLKAQHFLATPMVIGATSSLQLNLPCRAKVQIRSVKTG